MLFDKLKKIILAKIIDKSITTSLIHVAVNLSSESVTLVWIKASTCGGLCRIKRKRPEWRALILEWIVGDWTLLCNERA